MTSLQIDLLAEARRYEAQLVTFLRDLIAIPAESLHEGPRCERVHREYEALGFDEVRFDGLGSVVGTVGTGPLTVLMDGHIDCVGVGDTAAWSYDPFAGRLEDGKVFGRGAVDELPAVVCMAYAARIMKEHGLLDGVTLYLTASIMEEVCDGYCLLHLIENEGLRPDVVVLGEPTDLNVYRGQRGRVELAITTRGVSAHAAHAERGVNAVYKMAPIISDIERLNGHLPADAFLGKGSIVVSSIECTTPSLNAVPDSARIVIDRRTTSGETVDSVLRELRALPHLGDATVEVLEYEATSWRGTSARQEAVYPAWVLPEEHGLVQGVADAVRHVLGRSPKISRWGFSTNGVASMGRHGIPTVGFAPGLEELAHTTEEWVAVEDLVRAVAVYAAIPRFLVERRKQLAAAP